MPAANPLAESPTAGYAPTGSYSQLSSGAAAAGLSSQVGQKANVAIAVVLIAALATLVLLHALGFRFAFDASVGRR